jgi:SAM-dependent methyltransferase
MFKKFKRATRNILNIPLSLFGFELVMRGEAPLSDYRTYISFKKTLEDAEKAGLPVGDYIDLKCNKPGATQETIEQMTALGVFKTKVERVCEIGPGSGRYLEKTLKACSPAYYEIYETALDWKNWLVQKYDVVAQVTDGSSLSHTPSNSIDLVHAHKVMPGQPSLVMCCYFAEMARVVRDGGKVVFDIVSEDCMNDDMRQKWIDAKGGYQSYPCMMPEHYVLDFFTERGFLLDGSFFIPMEPGKTKYLVFTKSSS